MGGLIPWFKSSLRRSAAIVLFSLPLYAQTERLDELFRQLRTPDLPNYDQIESEIWAEWSKSGSASMDLLLQRGRAAMDAAGLADRHRVLHRPDRPCAGLRRRLECAGNRLFQAGLYGPSVEDIRHALALNPRHFGAMAGLAMIFEELGRNEDALKAWQRSRGIDAEQARPSRTISNDLEIKIGGQTL